MFICAACQAHSSPRAQMADGAAGESLAPLRGAFGSRKEHFHDLAPRTLSMASLLPAYAAGNAPTVLSTAFEAARKEKSACAWLQSCARHC